MKFSKILLLSILCFAQTVFANQPKLSFFNEMEGKDLKILFADTSLIPTLKKLNVEIRMGMLDISPERIAVIKQLNEAKIPVVAWLLLPKEKGYWFHSGNGDAAMARYKEIKKWADKSGILFSGIGIDLELDFNDIGLFKTNKIKLLGKIVSRLYDKEQVTNGRKKYEELLTLIKKDGYSVESYYVPFIRYENEGGNTSLQQVSGFLDLKTDKDIPMLYTSFSGNPYGMLKVLALDEKLKYIAIGSTGGGFDPTLKTMNWTDFEHDLRLASQIAEEIHIFSLEGAIEKGFLSKLINFDYNVAVPVRSEEVKSIQSLKSKVLTISTILSFPTLLIIGLLGMLVLIVWMVFRVINFTAKRLGFKKN